MTKDADDFTTGVLEMERKAMLEIKGKYNTAIVYTNEIDSASRGQVEQLCDQEFAKGEKIRMMPDIHAGAGCTIGTTMTISDKIVPNLVGVDIGCGMHTVMLKEKRVEMPRLDKVIRENVPSGMEIREKPHKYANAIRIEELRCYEHINAERAILSVGTLGGGNHFIEVDKDDEGLLYLVIHTGSRYLGKQVAEYYQKLGFEKLSKRSGTEVKAFIDRLKEEGRTSEIESELKAFKSSKHTDIPFSLAYVEGEDFDDYIHDMEIVQEFADFNRKAIAERILKEMKLHETDSFTTIHNYIDTKNKILRKGSVSAEKGERLLIPINMRDGSLLCVGKGNEDWNCSAPHGAGRLMSRSEAKNSFTVSEFKKQMDGIYTTSVSSATLDECPMAYKGMDAIVSNIGPTADIIKIIKPIYNYKAGEE